MQLIYYEEKRVARSDLFPSVVYYAHARKNMFEIRVWEIILAKRNYTKLIILVYHVRMYTNKFLKKECMGNYISIEKLHQVNNR